MSSGITPTSASSEGAIIYLASPPPGHTSPASPGNKKTQSQHLFSSFLPYVSDKTLALRHDLLLTPDYYYIKSTCYNTTYRVWATKDSRTRLFYFFTSTMGNCHNCMTHLLIQLSFDHIAIRKMSPSPPCLHLVRCQNWLATTTPFHVESPYPKSGLEGRRLIACGENDMKTPTTIPQDIEE